MFYAGIFFLFLAVWILIRPKNNREWSPDQDVLPYAEFRGRSVFLRNVRHCLYSSEDEYRARFFYKTVSLDNLSAVYLLHIPFQDLPFAAHLFLTFEFGTERISISIEARKRKKKKYNYFLTFFKQYELMYVVAVEDDPLLLRVLHRNDKVYRHPLNISLDEGRKLFTLMLERANRLCEKPEFYHPLVNSCTTALFRDMNRALDRKIPLHYSWVAVAYVDRLLRKRGILSPSLSCSEGRERYLVKK